MGKTTLFGVTRGLFTIALLIASAGAVLGSVAAAPAAGTESVAAKIEAAAPQAQLVFVATVTKVTTRGETKTEPPTVEMDVAVKEVSVLKGPDLDALGLPPSFTCSAVKGQGFTPAADQKVLVFGHSMLAHPIMGGPPTLPGQGQRIETKLNVHLLLAATDENVALARKVVGPNTPEGQLEAAVRSADLVFTATVAKLVMFGAVQPPIQQVTVKDVTMLKGEKPAHLECRYPRVLDLPLNPDLGQKVLCAARAEPKEAPLPPNSVSGRHTGPLPMLGGNGPEIVFMVEATEANVALARKALAAPASQPAK